MATQKGVRYNPEHMRLSALLLLNSLLLGDPRSDAVDRLLAGYRAGLPGGTPGPGCALGVIQNGRFVYQTAFGLADLETGAALNAATLFNVASMSKQFTAAALFFLVEQGKVRLTDSVRRFVPELPAYADAITIQDLLHHTSGLRDMHPLLEISGRQNETLDAAANLKMLAAQSALNFPPGTDYEYSNADYQLLGLIIERVSGGSLAAFAEAHIFRPAGMTHSEFQGGARPPGEHATGYTSDGKRFRQAGPPPLGAGDGGLYTTVEDLLLWDQKFYDTTAAGRRFVEFMEKRSRIRSGERIDYASGLTVRWYRGLKTVGHNGVLPGYQSDLTRYPSQHLTVVCLCNRGDVDAARVGLQVASVYLGTHLSPLRRGSAAVDYPASGFPRIDGVWESRQGFLMRAWSGVDGLSIQADEEPIKLFPLNRRQLFADDAGSRLVLTRLASDRIQLAWDYTRPEVYHRVAAVMPRQSELSVYAGDYHSTDAGARWRLVAEAGKLLITTAAGWRIPLEAAGSDRFMVGPWSLDFVRRADGGVARLELHRARLWRLEFERE
jgi:CubicO group peptidase (beta-lactamase class C family)